MAHPETVAAMTGRQGLACPDVRLRRQDLYQRRLPLRTTTSTSSSVIGARQWIMEERPLGIRVYLVVSADHHL
jgi:hypothetical protein